MNTIDWLVDSDPAIRWQAMRDLTDASPAAVASERARVAHEGLGTEILARQNEDGAWRRPDAPAWLSTLFTLLLLRSTGIDPADPAVESAVARLEKNMQWSCVGFWDLRAAGSGGNFFFEGEEEPCINGGVLTLGGYFGHPTESLAQRLIGEQLEDGGWNCEAPMSARSSFHTTICVLEGLLEYERAVGGSAEAAAARKRAEEYMLKRVLCRRLSTGEIVDAEFLKLAFPPRYVYDVLRALDYFRAAAIWENVRPSARVAEAVDIVKSKRQPDGKWLLDRASDEALAVPFHEVVGEPSRWNTLRALRVLRWYEEARG